MSLSVVVLISGSGSNLQALIDQSALGNLDISIKAVISNKKDAYGLERADKANIPTHAFSHKDYESRALYDQKLQETIDQYQPDLVVLAGFMRILTEEFTRHYQGKMFNIHPSLLPKYKGLNTHTRALEAKDEYHGVSVHFVSAELDAGAVIIQAKTKIEADDTEESLANKIHKLEHVIYPQAIQWFSEGRLIEKDSQAWLDDKALPTTGFQYQTKENLSA